MDELGVSDRFIDFFQDRRPRNVLAELYFPKETKLLREIYDKDNLTALN